MSNLVDRLERELVAAAEREARRAAPLRFPTLPVLRPALALAAAVGAVVVVLLASGGLRDRAEPPPPGARPGPLPAALLGEWTLGDSETFLILDGLRYTLDLPAGERVVGDAQAAGDVLLLGNDGAGACGNASALGRYGWTVAGRRLELDRVADPCPARRRALEAGLRRGAG